MTRELCNPFSAHHSVTAGNDSVPEDIVARLSKGWDLLTLTPRSHDASSQLIMTAKIAHYILDLSI
jgi:hypothetical protein